MPKTKEPLCLFITLFILSGIALSGCYGYNRAEERHEKSMQLRQQEIERRQLELDCLKRKQADPAIDCAQFHELGGPNK
jgi:hypothetical protein